MGIDAGFDMVPCLSKGAVDRRNWQSFIKTIKEHYQNDDLVEVKPNYIAFKAGEHPLLPFEGHKFLRFSSKISGSHAEGVEGCTGWRLGITRTASIPCHRATTYIDPLFLHRFNGYTSSSSHSLAYF